MTDTPEPPPRTQSRETRRAQLIEATIATIAARGYARTTLTEVAKAAGLSHGLVLFHFQTKERLLAETLAFMAEEYRQHRAAALAGAGPAPAARLAALIEADFQPAINTQSRLAACCAFWGEAQRRPFYQEACGSLDAEYTAELEAICAALVAEGGYPIPPAHAARILRLVIEGTWLDAVTLAEPYPVAEARQTVETTARLLFPRHFAG